MLQKFLGWLLSLLASSDGGKEKQTSSGSSALVPGLSPQENSAKKVKLSGIQNRCLALGNTGCFLFCYAWIAGVEENTVVALHDYLVAANIIEYDGYVKNAQLFFQYFNQAVIVTKTSDLLKIPKSDPYLGVWRYQDDAGKTHEHAVVMIRDDIVYNPLDNSQTIKKGKLVSIRIVERINL